MRFGNLLSSHAPCNGITLLNTLLNGNFSSWRKIVVDRNIEPHVCQYIILRNTLSQDVLPSKLFLCKNITLFRRQAIPLYRLFEIPGNTFSVVIYLSKAELCKSLSLFCGQSAPLSPFLVILRNTQSDVIHGSEL